MDGSLLPPPRLRVTRTSSSFPDDHMTTPVAGPSRLSPFHDDREEDTQSTPRIPITKNLDANNPPFATSSTPADTPAARLRALLARVPNDSSPPSYKHRSAAPSSPSETDSDFYPPHLSTPSTPHESLKELFSRALRDPGDTPDKSRRRRNSIDLSEVDASPRLDRVQKERAKSKGKRKSMSDEELEKGSRSSQNHSHATTLHTLRQRLANSEFDIDLKDVMPPSEQLLSDGSEGTSHDTATILRHLDSKNPRPAATSTPIRSMQFPSGIESGSNLLDQDSEMQRAMKNMDSYEDGSSAHPVIFPSTKQTATKGNHVLMKHGSDDFLHKSSNSTSTQSKSQILSQSKVSGLTRHHSVGSSPRGDSMAGATPTNIPSRRLATQHHANSIQSPKSSSMLSHSDHKEMMTEMQHETLKERERHWNRPNHTLTRSTSSLGHHATHERTRTISHPTSPDSAHALTADRLEQHRRSHSRNSVRADSPATSMANRSDLDKERHPDGQDELEHQRERNWNAPHPKLTPTHPSSASPTPSASSEHARSHRVSRGGTPDGRRSRFNSFSSSVSSRSSSPTGSLSSKDSQESVIHEVEHERERNWNSTHPKWLKRRSLQNLRPISPSPSLSVPLASPQHSHTHSRERVQSLTTRESSSPAPRPSLGNLTTHSAKSPASRPPIKHIMSPPELSLSSAHSYHSRPASPLPTPASPSVHKSPGYSSNFGWKFPKNRTPPASLELDLKDDSSPISSQSKPTSHTPVPIKSSKKSDPQERRSEEDESHSKGHRRFLTEFNGAVGPIPPKIHVDTITFPSIDNPQDVVHESDEDSPMGSTPLARPVSLPSGSTTPPGHVNDLVRLQKAIGSPQSQTSTPPPSPPNTSADPALSLVTPPRRLSFSTSRVEFQTPSPPKGMPELPSLPSSPYNEDALITTPIQQNGNLTTMKTPKPPGAWLKTPNQPYYSTTYLNQVDSMAEDTIDANGGLATPPTTLSKGNALPLQTPAPPGAWAGTPSIGSAARKSILKVRFDVAPSETETVSSVENGGDEISIESIEMVHPSDEGIVGFSRPETHETERLPLSAVDANNSEVSSRTPSPEEPATPVLKPVRALPRTPPGVRIVDAFGREHVEMLEEGLKTKEISQISLPPCQASPQASKPLNGGVRIVDAMGRQVEEAEDSQGVDECEEPLTRDQALSRVRETVSGLARQMSDIDLSSSSVDDSYLEGLLTTSNSARNARHKIVQTIHIVEDDLKLKYGSLRESMRKSNGYALPNVIHRSWLSRSRIITWIFCVAVVFMIVMNRLSHARARNLFLTTYYDPFDPDLYLHLVRPEYPVDTSMPPWSIYNIPDAFQRAGLEGVFSEFWGNVTFMISDWQRKTWESWGSHEWTNSNAWPPQ